MRQPHQRDLLIALCLAGCVLEALACSCFSPELRAKTARETLLLAGLAVFGRVVAVQPDGSGHVLVLESFKGAPKHSTIEIVPDPVRCPEARLALGEEILVLSFSEPVTLCSKHASEHFLVEAFRATAAK